MSIDGLLDRTYSRNRFNCLHFATEAWIAITGDHRLTKFKESEFGGRGTLAAFREFTKVVGPTIEPSVVLMDNVDGALHIGICINRHLLHIDCERPEFFPISNYQHRFTNLRYLR